MGAGGSLSKDTSAGAGLLIGGILSKEAEDGVGTDEELGWVLVVAVGVEDGPSCGTLTMEGGA